MTIAAGLTIAFFALCAAGVVAALVFPQRLGPALIGLLGSLAAIVLFVAGGFLLLGGPGFRLELWPLLTLGTLALRGDRLSGLFLVVTGIVFLPISLFSVRYLARYGARYSLRWFSLLYYALFAAVVLVLVAGDVISFLLGWEAMSIDCYLLVAYERAHAESSRAAYIMLAMSEAGAIAVAVGLILVADAAGSLDFAHWAAAPPMLGAGLGWAVFLLSFYGFGVKAGLVPVSSWLPLAHPVAPTNVSALLSAVIVNLGIYGIIRFDLDLAPVPGVGPGVVVLLTGAVTALIGILYATIQAEMKRLLAHSTIENMGIVAAGIGAGMVFFAEGFRVVGGMALIAALYHLANHSVYKALLFIGTGAVEAGTGTRDLDRLGGILKRMPWTGAFFLVGVLSISALPPFNGFVSEWLTLQTILRAVLLPAAAVKFAFAIAGALLALTAGLAGTCFVKVFAMGFLGMPRSPEAAGAGETRLGARAPLAFLALCCLLLGVLPTYVIPALDRAVVPISHQSAVAALVPSFFAPKAAGEALPPAFVGEFRSLGAQVGKGVVPGRGLVVLQRGPPWSPVAFAMSTSYMILVLAALLAIVFVAFRLLTRGRTLLRGAVWAGGVRRLRPETTYTATGFSNPVRVVFRMIVNPRAPEDSTEAVAQHFRTAIRRGAAEVHIVDRLVLDAPVRLLERLAVVRRLHLGPVNAYAAYVLAALIIVLAIGVALR
jgi:hydrogenase-4 component B